MRDTMRCGVWPTERIVMSYVSTGKAGKWAAHFRGLKVLFWTLKFRCMSGIHVVMLIEA